MLSSEPRPREEGAVQQGEGDDLIPRRVWSHLKAVGHCGILLVAAASARGHPARGSVSSPAGRGRPQAATLPAPLSVEVLSNASEGNLGGLLRSTVSVQGFVLRRSSTARCLFEQALSPDRELVQVGRFCISL